MLEELFSYLREFNMVSVALRLLLAMVFGGYIGLDRGRKRRAAGLRTHILVSLGAALTMILGQYELHMLTYVWPEIAADIGIRTDVSRFGAQVINGIGFLGAGTVIVTKKQSVQGLTTAAALWASACMGLAAGAGFYECVILAFALIFLCVRILPYVEMYIIENARNINVYVEFMSLDNIGEIIACLKAQDVQIFEVDINHGREDWSKYPSAVFSVRLNQKISHEQFLAVIADLKCVRVIDEI